MDSDKYPTIGTYCLDAKSTWPKAALKVYN